MASGVSRTNTNVNTNTVTNENEQNQPVVRKKELKQQKQKLGKPNKKEQLPLVTGLLTKKEIKRVPVNSPIMLNKLSKQGFSLKGLSVREGDALPGQDIVKVTRNSAGDVQTGERVRPTKGLKSLSPYQRWSMRRLLQKDLQQVEIKLNKLLSDGYALEGLGLYTNPADMQDSRSFLVKVENNILSIEGFLHKGVLVKTDRQDLEKLNPTVEDGAKTKKYSETFKVPSLLEEMLKNINKLKDPNLSSKLEKILNKSPLTGKDLLEARDLILQRATYYQQYAGKLFDIKKTLGQYVFVPFVERGEQSQVSGTASDPRLLQLNANQEYLNIVSDLIQQLLSKGTLTLDSLSVAAQLLGDIEKVKSIQGSSVISFLNKNPSPLLTHPAIMKGNPFRLNSDLLPDLKNSATDLVISSSLYISDPNDPKTNKSGFNREKGISLILLHPIIMQGKAGAECCSVEEHKEICKALRESISKIKTLLQKKTVSLGDVFHSNFITEQNAMGGAIRTRQLEAQAKSILQIVLQQYEEFMEAIPSSSSLETLLDVKIGILSSHEHYKGMLREMASVNLPQLTKEHVKNFEDFQVPVPEEERNLLPDNFFVSIEPQNIETSKRILKNSLSQLVNNDSEEMKVFSNSNKTVQQYFMTLFQGSDKNITKTCNITVLSSSPIVLKNILMALPTKERQLFYQHLDKHTQKTLLEKLSFLENDSFFASIYCNTVIPRDNLKTYVKSTSLHDSNLLKKLLLVIEGKALQTVVETMTKGQFSQVCKSFNSLEAHTLLKKLPIEHRRLIFPYLQKISGFHL